MIVENVERQATSFSLRSRLDRWATSVERFLVGDTWAMERGVFGRWPQGESDFFDRFFAQTDIDSTTNPTYEKIKLRAAWNFGLEVYPKVRNMENRWYTTNDEFLQFLQS